MTMSVDGQTANEMVRLCAVGDIEDNSSQEFDVEIAGVRRYLIGVRQGEKIFVYLDYCPHMGYPEKFVDMRFLCTYSQKFYCAVHGARFNPDDGACVGGPPSGDFLGRFETRIENGEVYVGGALTWPGRDKILAKRQALIDAYKAQAKAREEEEARQKANKREDGEANAR
jgi:nitrite reductase/ring-hydroxylating ferredoxin subunit